MRISVWGRLMVSGISVVVAATLASPAPAAEDTTAPTLTAPVKASFEVGEQIDVGAPLICGDDPHDIRVYRVPITFSWSGSDDGSSDVHYSLDAVTAAGGPEEVFTDSSRTSYSAFAGSNEDQTCGGGNWSIWKWNLTAADAAGNDVTAEVYGGRVRLTQNTGRADRAGYATRPTIEYAGSWKRSRCGCWSDKTVHRTSTRGASVTISPQRFIGISGVKTHRVGLVMHMGPDRGKFRIVVDGKRRTTVDLYSPTSRPRVIVWQTAFGSFGHRIKLVNLATPGRPRIDLDAVLTN